MSIKQEVEWFSVDEKLPKVPKGRFAVNVLCVILDESCIEGSYTIELMYGSTSDRHNNKLSPWENSNLDFDFQELLQGLFDDTDWVPTFDKVIYWMYLPKVQIETKISELVTNDES